MADICAGLGGAQERPSCKPKLAASTAGYAEATCWLFEGFYESPKHKAREAILMENSLETP